MQAFRPGVEVVALKLLGGRMAACSVVDLVEAIDVFRVDLGRGALRRWREYLRPSLLVTNGTWFTADRRSTGMSWPAYERCAALTLAERHYGER